MFLENPYHRLGLLADTDARAYTKRVGRINAQLAAEMALEFQPDLVLPGCMRNSKTMEVAQRELQTGQGKVQHGLFWFTGSGIVDGPTLEEVRQGRFDNALATWRKAAERSEIGENQISSLNNYGTLLLVMAVTNPKKNLSLTERQELFLEGFLAKVDLLDKPTGLVLKGFIESIGDSIIAGQREKVQTLMVDALESLLDSASLAGLSVSMEHLAKRLAGKGAIAAAVLKPFQNSVRAELEDLLKRTNAQIEKGGNAAFKAAKSLQLQAPELLEQYRQVADADDVYVTSLADKVAEVILQGGIKYFNGHDDIGLNEVSKVLTLTNGARKIAVGAALRDRLDENIATLKERKKDEQKTAHIKRESAALFSAIEDAISDKASMMAENARQVTNEFKHEGGWGILAALNAMKEKGVASDSGFARSDGFRDACSGAFNVMLSKVIADFNAVQEFFDPSNAFTSLDDTTSRLKLCRSAVSLMLSTNYPLDRQTKKRIAENQATMNQVVQQLDSAMSRARRQNSGCAVLFWILGGASLLAILSGCL